VDWSAGEPRSKITPERDRIEVEHLARVDDQRVNFAAEKRSEGVRKSPRRKCGLDDILESRKRLSVAVSGQ